SVAQTGANDAHRRAEAVLQPGEDHRAGRQRAGALLADAVPLDDLSGGCLGEQAEQLVELVDADAAARDPLQRARGAADGERGPRRRRAEAVQIALDLGPRVPDRGSARRVGGEHAAREALRAEIDRTRPLRPLAAGTDDDLGGAA